MCLHNLFSLLHLHAKQTKGKKPLGDYSQSHVVKSIIFIRKKVVLQLGL
jgi:hypothetical protein